MDNASTNTRDTTSIKWTLSSTLATFFRILLELPGTA